MRRTDTMVGRSGGVAGWTTGRAGGIGQQRRCPRWSPARTPRASVAIARGRGYSHQLRCRAGPCWSTGGVALQKRSRLRDELIRWPMAEIDAAGPLPPLQARAVGLARPARSCASYSHPAGGASSPGLPLQRAVRAGHASSAHIAFAAIRFATGSEGDVQPQHRDRLPACHPRMGSTPSAAITSALISTTAVPGVRRWPHHAAMSRNTWRPARACAAGRCHRAPTAAAADPRPSPVGRPALAGAGSIPASLRHAILSRWRLRVDPAAAVARCSSRQPAILEQGHRLRWSTGAPGCRLEAVRYVRPRAGARPRR